MSYSIRRIDGRVVQGLSAKDVRGRAERGELWPDEEIQDEGRPGWQPLSKVPQLADALATGEAARANTTTRDAESLVREMGPAVLHLLSSGSYGTGFAIDAEGTILTNQHVVFDTTMCRIRFQSGLESTGRVLLRSPRLDLAIVRCALPTPDHLELPARRPTRLTQGSRACALGYPSPLGVFTVTEGLLSAQSVQLDGLRWHQISAAVNPGNSGGPVMGGRGELIGVATLKGVQTEGVAWAIPFEDVVGFVRQFWSEVESGHIGIPSAIELMRETSRPPHGGEIRLAVRRLSLEYGFRLLKSRTDSDGVLRTAHMVSPHGVPLSIHLDPYPPGNTSPDAFEYLYMYSSLGKIPAEAASSPRFLGDLLSHNQLTPHWQFSIRDDELILRYCRDARLLDSSEVVVVAEDLIFLAKHFSADPD